MVVAVALDDVVKQNEQTEDRDAASTKMSRGLVIDISVVPAGIEYEGVRPLPNDGWWIGEVILISDMSSENVEI